jgi:hypothetical protein
LGRKKDETKHSKATFLDLFQKENQLFSCLEEASTLDELSLKSKQPIPKQLSYYFN